LVGRGHASQARQRYRSGHGVAAMITSIDTYPIRWPYKGLVFAHMDQNEDRLPTLIVVLQNVIEFWESQHITGPTIAKLMLEAKTVLAGVEAAYANDDILMSPHIYMLVGQLTSILDKLAPEHTYFGENTTHAGQYGFWSDAPLYQQEMFLRA